MTNFGSSDPFCIGVEEEFQILDPDTGDLVSRVDEVIGKSGPELEENLTTEIFQAVVETKTDVCQDVGELRTEIQRLRGALGDFTQDRGYAIAAAGTHPFARWEDQDVTEKDRYKELVEEMRWAAKRELIFGQHVHVSVERPDQAIAVTNGLRPFLPVLLALSVNSPFWKGRETGLMSTRVRIFDALPRTGVPREFQDWPDFQGTLQELIEAGSVEDVTKIWWDVRPRHDLGTVEVRIADLPTETEDSVALAALTKALVVTLAHRHDEGLAQPVNHSQEVIEENRWRALRGGLEGNLIQRNGDDEVEEVPAVDAVSSTLDLVADTAADLGLQSEMRRIRNLVKTQGTGARRQLDVYERTGDLTEVVHDIVDRTLP